MSLSYTLKRMDSGAQNTQRIVITIAVILGIIIVLIIGYSLYTKAKRAEGELANKVALDTQTKSDTEKVNVSLTGEAKNSSTFSYDGLVQKKDNANATTTNFGIVDEQVPVEPPQETTPKEEAVPPEENQIPQETTTLTEPAAPVVVDNDQPLTQEEIMRIRQLPIDDSPSGQLQAALEEESNGQYKARY